jgi:hypothetical protein
MKNIKLLIAAHKQYQMPADSIYFPLHVGAQGKEHITGFTPDNTGDNISTKNPYYCELTGLYWAWKNLDADYIGLCHYRRYMIYRFKYNNPSKKYFNNKFSKYRQYRKNIKHKRKNRIKY